MEEESRLVEALVEETQHSMIVFDELEATRWLMLDIVSVLVNHGKIGETWKRLFSEQILGDIDKVMSGSYLTKEMSDGEEENGSTETGRSKREKQEGGKESVKQGNTEVHVAQAVAP